MAISVDNTEIVGVLTDANMSKPKKISSQNVLEDQLSQAKLEQVAISDKILSKISGIEISISIDDDSIPPVVRIFDRSSGNEIVQIPTSTSVAIQKSVDELIGLVFDRKA